MKSQTETVLRTLDAAHTRNRAMGRVLRDVEALPADQADAMLPAPVGNNGGDDED